MVEFMNDVVKTLSDMSEVILYNLFFTTVCNFQCRKRKHARHVITFFARVANRSFELSNFNSSMAILTGLSFGPVTRLKKTWNKLSLSELTKLQVKLFFHQLFVLRDTLSDNFYHHKKALSFIHFQYLANGYSK